MSDTPPTPDPEQQPEPEPEPEPEVPDSNKVSNEEAGRPAVKIEQTFENSPEQANGPRPEAQPQASGTPEPESTPEEPQAAAGDDSRPDEAEGAHQAL